MYTRVHFELSLRMRIGGSPNAARAAAGCMRQPFCKWREARGERSEGNNFTCRVSTGSSILSRPGFSPLALSLEAVGAQTGALQTRQEAP